jgi:hypothetical protein
MEVETTVKNGKTKTDENLFLPILWSTKFMSEMKHGSPTEGFWIRYQVIMVELEITELHSLSFEPAKWLCYGIDLRSPRLSL